MVLVGKAERCGCVARSLCAVAGFTTVASNSRIAVTAKGELMRIFRFVLLTVATLALAGCSIFESKKEPAFCPRVSVLADAATLTRFQPGPGRDPTDVDLQAEFNSYHGTCAYDAQTKVMDILMQVGVDAKLGPAAKSRKADIGYFVAIPAFFGNPKGKVVMPVNLVFPDGTDRVRFVDDEVELSIPIPNLDELNRYEVFVGLQLLPAEVDYNRQVKGQN